MTVKSVNKMKHPAAISLTRSSQTKPASVVCLDVLFYCFNFWLVSRIALVKPEKGRSLEDFLISSMQAGRIRNRVTEPDLLNILDQIDAQEQRQKPSKITVCHGLFYFRPFTPST